MELFIQKLISSFIEIILFAAIPFVFWLIKGRKQSTFLNWLGFKKINKQDLKGLVVPFLLVAITFMFISVYLLFRLRDVQTATTVFRSGGFKVLPAIMVYGILGTALPEELFFRGFLLKRLLQKLPYRTANVIQSLLFALLHGIIFFSLLDLVSTVMVIVFTFAIAYGMGYLNEEKAQGSILPSWIIHATANIFAGVCAAFLLV